MLFARRRWLTNGAAVCVHAAVACVRAPIGLALPAYVAACSSLTDATRLHLSESRLREELERQFPRRHRLMNLVEVSASSPLLSLLPDRNRMRTELTLAIAPLGGQRAEVGASMHRVGHEARTPFVAATAPMQGVLAFEYGLRFQASDMTVRLKDVDVDRMSLQSGNSLPWWMSGLGRAFAEEALDNLTVVRLTDEQQGMLKRLSLDRAFITVTGSGLAIRFSKSPG
jgi:hypothetical protein